MKEFSWTSDYSVRIAALDSEHRELLNKLQELLRLVSLGEVMEANKLIDVFAILSAEHFKHEEKLLEETSYPGLDKQTREHAQFTKKLEGFLNKAKETPAVLTPTAITDLGKWCVEHIVGADRAYSEYLSDHGIK